MCCGGAASHSVAALLEEDDNEMIGWSILIRGDDDLSERNTIHE